MIGPPGWGSSQCLQKTWLVLSMTAFIPALPLVHRDQESPPIGQGERLRSDRTKTPSPWGVGDLGAGCSEAKTNLLSLSRPGGLRGTTGVQRRPARPSVPGTLDSIPEPRCLHCNMQIHPMDRGHHEKIFLIDHAPISRFFCPEQETHRNKASMI